MNREMIKELMSNIDLVKELDEYGKNKLATLMEGLLIEIMGRDTNIYLKIQKTKETEAIKEA